MIGQKFYIDKYDWQVVVLYEASGSDTSYIVSMLKQMGADWNVISKAYDNITANNFNTGFTYSDLKEGKSLIVIGKTNSNGELLNTIVHEANHLQSHIATAYSLDEKGEEVCYLIGGIVKTMYEVFRKFICS